VLIHLGQIYGIRGCTLANPPSPLIDPTLRADLPVYPALIEICRVTSATVTGPPGCTANLYLSYIEQIDTTTLMPRDRITCLVDDLTGIGLVPGPYVCRLVGAYAGYPVYAAQLGAGGGPAPPPDDYCSLASTQNTDCILAEGPYGSVVLMYSGGEWTSDIPIYYPDCDDITSGILVFSYSDGSLHLILDGKELLNCGDGCFTGGPLTLHEPQDCGPPCMGVTFSICLTCIPCTSGTSGSGDGCGNCLNGSNGSTKDLCGICPGTPCCSELPSSLCLTVLDNSIFFGYFPPINVGDKTTLSLGAAGDPCSWGGTLDGHTITVKSDGTPTGYQPTVDGTNVVGWTVIACNFNTSNTYLQIASGSCGTIPVAFFAILNGTLHGVPFVNYMITLPYNASLPGTGYLGSDSNISMSLVCSQNGFFTAAVELKSGAGGADGRIAMICKPCCIGDGTLMGAGGNLFARVST
jgi:hypothetical protein